MDYLKAFAIGTSGPVWFLHMRFLALADDNYYNFSLKQYSLVAPIYYGLMSMLALYIGNEFDLSLRQRLFITSLISVTFIVSLSYFVVSKYYKPYKNYTTNEWLAYILRNGSRHLINFNLIIYYFTKYFSYYWLKVFIIGSSIFSYFITFLNVMWADSKNKLNYDYKLFATMVPIIQGVDLLIPLYILQNILNVSLKYSLILWSIFNPLFILSLVYSFKLYKYKGIEWMYYLLHMIITSFVCIIPIYYLLNN